MKIYYLSDSLVPSTTANSVHVMKMCQAFTKNNHNVMLIAYKSNASINNVYSYYGVERCFDIQAMTFCPFPGIKRLLRIRYVREYVKRSLPPDLFYGRDLYSLLSIANFGRPLVYEAHFPPQNRLDNYLTSRLFLNKNFKRLVVISNALRLKYLELYPWLPKEYLLVAHDSADKRCFSENFELDKTWPGRLGILQVGYAGNLYSGKGMEVILLLARKLRDFDFHIVGGDEKRIRHLKRIYKGKNVYFHGHIPPINVYDYLKKFDIVLAPYQGKVMAAGGKIEISRWMSPMKIFEYMAAGKAIICSDLPVLREILSHKINAWLVPADSIKSWIEAIHNLGSDIKLRMSLGNRAQSDFLAQYTWERRAGTVLFGLK